jgi:hypothetical protein
VIFIIPPIRDAAQIFLRFPDMLGILGLLFGLGLRLLRRHLLLEFLYSRRDFLPFSV